MTETFEGALLWEPDEASKTQSRIHDYMRWLRVEYGLSFERYDELWRWSVRELEQFWESIWKYFDVQASKPYHRVLSSRAMPGARFFEGAELNYAQQALRREGDALAIIYTREDGTRGELSWNALRDRVARARNGFRKLGVERGDCVAAFLPNSAEAVIGLLACASLGATWSSCSPEFGATSVLDRFSQISPKLLLAVDGYQYGGKSFDCVATVQQIVSALPTLVATIHVPRLTSAAPSGWLPFDDVLA
ncbi:MAG TPA: AMP-binding protein, partial [Polyangiales bacterium]|nr:AMP-binding protein [Polyangiales bacterium]